MRKLLLVASVSLFAAACSDSGPTAPLEAPPTVRLSHVGSVPGQSTAGDLCGGLSPCDAYDYDRDLNGTPDGITGVPGFCFLSPMVDNHLSDPACSDPFVPGLDGIFQLAWCQVQYPVSASGELDGTQPPTIVSCQDSSQWQPLVRDTGGGEFYTASVQFKRPQFADGTVFRLYVVRADVHFAHRDVIVDPNLTFPADAFVHSIGHGAEPVKVRITQSFTCVYYDTQANDPDNAATCLIDGETSFSLSTNIVATQFDFHEGNPPAIFDFEISECSTLRGDDDNVLVDVPLAACTISVSSDLKELDVPAQIWVDVNDPRWSTGPFVNARPSVIQADEFGVRTLPPHDAFPWFTSIVGTGPLGRWLHRGLDKLASLVLPEPLYAFPGAGFDWKTTSDFTVALMDVAHADESMVGGPCASGVPSCLDLGTFDSGETVPVTVHVDAPEATLEGAPFDVPGARVHVFQETGSVACPASPVDPDQQCYEAGEADASVSPPNTWINPERLVIITGSTGRATFDYTLADGDNEVHVVSCGTAVPGTKEVLTSEGRYGIAGDCSDRYYAMSHADYDNGAGPLETAPFEPIDTEHEVAIYAPPLTFVAHTCPQIVVDGQKGTDEWDACATKQGFIAPLKGPKPSTDNAWLYTYNDAGTLYVALEVETTDLGNKIFINFAEEHGGILQDAAGDELLQIDFGGSLTDNDWHYTQQCVGNNSSSLCGDRDLNTNDGTGKSVQAAASSTGANGHVFYEFSRPLGSLNDGTGATSKEDLHAGPGDTIGILVNVTQGQGGGKGGFVYPDPQTSPVKYYSYTMK